MQEYPSSEWVETQLLSKRLCQATRQSLAEHAAFSATDAANSEGCKGINSSFVAETLQQAWRDYFAGDYQSAAAQGESLGPIGYPVGGYARIVYGQVLAPSSEEKAQVLKQAIAYADAYEEISPGSAYSLFISTYAMVSILEDLSKGGALMTGYQNELKIRLETLIQAYPKHLKGAANYGRYNAYIIDESGRFLGRISYNTSAEKMESGFATAMKVEPPILSNDVEYTIAMEQVYGDKEQNKSQQVLENVIDTPPVDAEDALQIKRAAALLAQRQKE